MAADEGRILGYYHNVAHISLALPLAIVLPLAIIYNIFIGFSVKWMHKHAWKVKSCTNYDKEPPNDSVWNEVFVVNFKLVGYLLGGSVSLKQDSKGYYTLYLHDYEMYMPLGIIFLQLCQLATVLVCVIIFIDATILQISTTCDGRGIDCFLINETNTSALPLNCEDYLNLNKTNELTCFRVNFTPVVAAASVGGFIKLVPQLLFSVLTLKYIKILNQIKRKLSARKTNGKNRLVTHIMAVVILEVCIIGFGVFVLLVLFVEPNFRKVTYATSNPFLHLKLNFNFLIYFMTAGFLWCIYPLDYKPRFNKSLASDQSTSGSLPGELNTIDV